MQVIERFKKTEVGLIPLDWDVRPCSAICSLITVGIVIRPASYYVKEGIPAFRSANIRETGINTSDLVFISHKSNTLLAKSQIRSGDVLTVRTGYPGTTAVVPPELAGSNCIDILISRPTSIISSEYLAFWINSSKGKDQVLRNQGGLAQQHFNVGDMRNLLVALPPINEQQAISVSLLNISSVIEGLKKLIDKKRDIKQATMQQLLTGKTRLPGFIGKWITKQIGELCNYQNGKALEMFFNKSVGKRVISIGNYSVEGTFIESDNFIDTYKYPQTKGFVLDKDDLALLLNDKTAVGTIIGRAILIDEEDSYVFNQRTMRLKVKGEILPAYLWNAINCNEYHRVFVNLAKPGTQIYINTGDVLNFKITIPTDLKEQSAIVEIISSLANELTALDRKLSKLKLLKQGMMQELLTGRIRLV